MVRLMTLSVFKSVEHQIYEQGIGNDVKKAVVV
jgi:hypothetical protein